MYEEIIIGTEFKILVNMSPIGNLNLGNLDFKCSFYVLPNKSLEVLKSQMIKQDNDNYIALVDSKQIGLGNLKCKVTVNIPDSDFNDLLRTEVVIIDTNINIIK